MKEHSIGQYINSYVFSAGRRLITAQHIEEVARDVGDAALARQAAAAAQADRQVWQLKNQWEQERKKAEGTRADALEIDRQLDRSLSGCHTVAQGFLHSLDPGEPQYDIAKEFAETFFPDGVRAVTGQPYEEQIVAVDAMLTQWQGPWATKIASLGLTALASRIANLTMQYRAAITTVRTREVSWEEVREQEQNGQEAMLRLIARVLGAHNTDTPADIELRARYLATFNDQNTRIAELRRRGPQVPDIDPATGEELNEPPQPEAEPADAGAP